MNNPNMNDRNLKPEGDITAEEQELLVEFLNDDRISKRERFQFGCFLAGAVDSVFVRVNRAALDILEEHPDAHFVLNRVTTGLFDAFISRDPENIDNAKMDASRMELARALDFPEDVEEAFENGEYMSQRDIKRRVNKNKLTHDQARMLSLLPYLPPKDRENITEHIEEGIHIYETVNSFANENKVYILALLMEEVSESYENNELYPLKTWEIIFGLFISVIFSGFGFPSAGALVGSLVIADGISMYERFRDTLLFEYVPGFWEPVDENEIKEIPEKEL